MALTHHFRGTALFRIVLPVLLSASCIAADANAVVPVGGDSGTDTRPFVIGWAFSVASPTTVTGLSYLDATGQGLRESHVVGIFDASDGSLLVSATVAAGASTTLVDGFRVARVTYNLAPGTYIIAGQKATNSDFAIVRSSSQISIPGITYIEERELETDSFAMPTTHFVDNEIGAFGPSFTVAVPAGTPMITAVDNAASFQPVFAPNTYISIFGSGLSSSTRTWAASDFTNGTQLPQALDGISVTVSGTPAYVEYVSSSQINIVTPDIATTGNGIPLVINVPGQKPVTAWMGVQPTAPAFFTWQPSTSDTGKYLVAQHLDYSNAGKTGLFPDKPASYTTPVKPGETIILYGTGFSATNPVSGSVTDKVYGLSPAPAATIGGLPAQVLFAGLIPGFAQVYQFNITVPAGIPDGDATLLVNVNGTLSAAGLITVAH
jgi:uncharacterized protein (TIGR03437 family)